MDERHCHTQQIFSAASYTEDGLVERTTQFLDTKLVLIAWYGIRTEFILSALLNLFR